MSSFSREERSATLRVRAATPQSGCLYCSSVQKSASPGRDVTRVARHNLDDVASFSPHEAKRSELIKSDVGHPHAESGQHALLVHRNRSIMVAEDISGVGCVGTRFIHRPLNDLRIDEPTQIVDALALNVPGKGDDDLASPYGIGLR